MVGEGCVRRDNQFNSILYFNSHRAIQFLLFITLSMSSINYTVGLAVFHYIIHDCLFIICMFCGNREGISGLPCSTLKSVDAQCSIALLFNFIYSHVIHIMPLTSEMKGAGRATDINTWTCSQLTSYHWIPKLQRAQGKIGQANSLQFTLCKLNLRPCDVAAAYVDNDCYGWRN